MSRRSRDSPGLEVTLRCVRVSTTTVTWLPTGSEGYALPDVRFSAAGGRINIDWKSRTAERSRLEFRNSGSIDIDRDEFLRSCSELIETVARRLTASDQFVDRDQVADLAEEFGASPYVVEHQIENHRIAELVDA